MAAEPLNHITLALHETLTVATSWAILDGPVRPLAKLKLDELEPFRGSARIILVACKYAGMWRHIVGGGLIAAGPGSACRKRPQRQGYVPGRHAGLSTAGHRFIPRYTAPDACA